ncbi:MAG: hypothetical protein SFY69_12465 [Planctomycetota bacterium]|nr:hypothetical protein [Planctomycetota bacterium]
MHDFVWNLYQQRSIDDVRGDLARSTSDLERDVTRVQDRVDRLALINAAMWELVVARLGLSQEEIEAKVQEVDLRDGVLDGRVSRTDGPYQCVKCSRTLMQRHRTCLYCGQPHAPDISPVV